MTGTQPPQPFATGGVAAVAVTSLVVLTLSASRYGYFGDELYFLAAGRRLSHGYADQGPVLPLLAWTMDSVAPGSLVALRFPAIVLTVLAVVLSALIARELGGGRAAQVLTAIAYATSPFLLLQGKMLSTNAIDTALWVVITWLVVRWVRTRRDVLLLCAGLVTAVDMQVKWLIPFFWLAVAVSALILGPRDLVRRPLLWVGAGITVAATIPTLVWQAEHDWPQLGMGAVVSGEGQYSGGRILFVPLAVLIAGLLGGLLLCYGALALWRQQSLREYRFLGAALLLLTAFFLVSGGRIYYVAGMYAVVCAAGAVALVERTARVGTSTRRWLIGGGALMVSASILLVLSSTPWRAESAIEPAGSVEDAALDIGLYGEFGWPELAAEVEQAAATLTPAERAGAVIVTETYWQAGALDQLGRDTLPPVYSPARGFGYFGTPPETATTLICVGGAEQELRERFADLDAIGRVDTRLGFPGNTQNVTLWKCSNPRASWAVLWPEWMHL
ncbi:glycosyltransferase family 39 protein [Nocardia cyriacigeorgica]|uniref:Glycosyltransferase family 39 protein n=1 Tax=Nocardia cyriacigeorgica TaxID=135487 RepID=A0ABX0CQZ4_9NOCA|nr:glycosyltransferase family 39 protein [Nocardia cyriacigeorgica]NEW37314.1 glycosyltransferase family 39 protein [Nocardia cyriacigeorgica]NEW58910.1 glycosyltransferase family 39 protein [Nocardia cyriacigeorgica]